MDLATLLNMFSLFDFPRIVFVTQDPGPKSGMVAVFSSL